MPRRSAAAPNQERVQPTLQREAAAEMRTLRRSRLDQRLTASPAEADHGHEREHANRRYECCGQDNHGDPFYAAEIVEATPRSPPAHGRRSVGAIDERLAPGGLRTRETTVSLRADGGESELRKRPVQRRLGGRPSPRPMALPCVCQLLPQLPRPRSFAVPSTHAAARVGKGPTGPLCVQARERLLGWPTLRPWWVGSLPTTNAGAALAPPPRARPAPPCARRSRLGSRR